MKKICTPLFCLALLLFALPCLYGQPSDNGNVATFAAAKSAAEMQLLVEKFGQSIVTVSYYFKLDEETGLPPNYRVRYLCPNCNSYHDGSISELMKGNQPLKTVGFYVGDKTVVTQNLSLRIPWIHRIEIRSAAGKTFKASVAAFCNEENALKLALAEEDNSLTALTFSEENALPAKAFYIAKENGVKIGGIRPLSENNVKYSIEAAKAFYSCPVNTLLLDAKNAPVSIMFTENRSVDTPITAPSNWNWADTAAYEKALADIETDIASSFYPVTITLKSTSEKNKSPRVMIFKSDNDSDDNEFHCFAFRQEDDTLLAFLMLDPVQTARFDRATVVTKAGKTIKAEFVGSLRKYGIILLKPEAPLTAGKVQLGNENTLPASMLDDVIACTLTNNGKSVTAHALRTRLLPSDSDLEGTAPRLAQVSSDDNTFVLTKDLKLCIANVQRRSIDEEDYSARRGEPRCIADIAEILASSSPFDANNVPKTKGEQTKQLVDFGAEFQKLTKQMVKAKKLERFFDMSDYELKGCIVTYVRPDTIAAKIGLKSNDIVLYARPADEFARVAVKNDEMDLFGEDFPWDEYDQLPEDAFEYVPQPWGTIDTPLNTALAKIGIGNDAVIAYIRDGKFQEAYFTVTASENCYENAPRHKSKGLGLTIAPLTPEVREYFKMKDDAPGVVIAAVKSGSPASKAGLKPYEIITAINGTDIHSIDKFKELTTTPAELSLSIRRLIKSRVVKITPAE